MLVYSSIEKQCTLHFNNPILKRFRSVVHISNVGEIYVSPKCDKLFSLFLRVY